MGNLFKGTRKIQISILLISMISFFSALLMTSSIQYVIYKINPYLLINLAYFSVPFFTVLFVLVFWALTRRMVTDLITLEQGLHIMSEGNLDYRVSIRRRDEIGRVAININLMAERLKRQIVKEREAERSKMELITGISHDLRTPLTSIIGYIDLLKTESFQSKEEYTRFLQNTSNKAVHLKKMLDDLFDYTRLTAKETQLHLESIDVTKLLAQLYFEFEPLAQEQGLVLDSKLGQTPIITYADNEKLARAIDNLLMNALKYSIKPGIVSIELNGDDDHIRVTIKNRGNSLTQEQENRLFERFYKADQARSTEGLQTGAGLGLAIARNIIELHEGSLTLQHNNGIFAFTLQWPVQTSLPYPSNKL